jgi:hypothetical protein
MTVVTLLVCAPVLFGLALIFIEPWRDPAWFFDPFVSPAKHPLLWAYLLFVSRGAFTPNAGATGDDNDERRAALTGLKWIADVLWAMAIGIFICLIIVVDEKAVEMGRENIAAYVAFGLAAFSIALAWYDRRRRRESALTQSQN